MRDGGVERGSLRAALLVLAALLSGIVFLPWWPTPRWLLSGALLALAAGGLAGLCAALLPKRTLVVALLALAPLWFRHELTFALERVAARWSLPVPAAYLLGAACLCALATVRAYRLLALLVALSSSLVLGFLPERHEDLRAMTLGVLCASSALLTRAPFEVVRVPIALRRVLVSAALWASCALTAHVTLERMGPGERASLPRRGALAALVRAGQRISDVDDDGHGSAFGQHDCALADALSHPEAHELPGNTRDENCLAGPAPHDRDFARREEARNPLPPPGRPDIVLLVVDALRYDATLADDLRFFAMLRAQSVWFEQAYGSASFTSLALPALLAAQIPSAVPMRFRGNLYGLPVSPVGGLVPWLVRAGYDTAFAGGTDEENGYFLESTFLAGVRVRRNLSMHASAAELRSTALEAHRALDAGRPRFLYVHAMSVHEPHDDRAAYQRQVRELDDELFALHAALGPGALWVVTADHGEEFGEHGGDYHSRTLFDEVMHVPLAVLSPAFAPRHVRAVTATRSLFPTLAAMVTPAKAPAGLGPYWCLTDAPCRDLPVPMALEMPGIHLHALRLGTHKIVRDLVLGSLVSYDLERDGHERTPEQPGAPLRRVFEAWEEHAFGAGNGTQVWPYEGP